MGSRWTFRLRPGLGCWERTKAATVVGTKWGRRAVDLYNSSDGVVILTFLLAYNSCSGY